MYWCFKFIEKTAFNRKSLAKEIMLASEANPDSYAIGKKEEIERQAEAAHN